MIRPLPGTTLLTSRSPSLTAGTFALGVLAAAAAPAWAAAAPPAMPVPAAAASSPLAGPARRFFALDLDGGFTRGSAGWRGFGRLGAGVASLDGERLLAATAEVGIHGGAGRPTLGLGGQYAHVQSGLGATATAFWDLERAGVGAALGVSFSLLHLQVRLLPAALAGQGATLFLRLPAGLLWQVLRRRDQGAAASVQTRPGPAGLQR